jgi:TPR repeat protein
MNTAKKTTGKRPTTPATAHQIVQLWEPLAQRGHPRAQYILGRMYADGSGAPRNPAKSAAWLTKAAEQGNADAQICMGIMHSKGFGVTRNHNKSAHWFRQAAEQGVVKAQCYLSHMYAQGIGVPRSLIYAYMWAMLAATGGRYSTTTAPMGNEKLRAHALKTLETYAKQMNKEEASAAIRMAKRWRERQQLLTD